jgi:hypothetical protein
VAACVTQGKSRNSVMHPGIMMQSGIERKISKLQGSTTGPKSDDSVLVTYTMPQGAFVVNLDS